ncbi:unnamed protein product [Ranitomeya imitator]|uniref:Reverse transcriptase domain-containing protein n=1 Tax=Ranitomeya imitator TaxID=111125 RepID=A0ABN9KS13_9NEOB|nr:unnamed protein product [Ranitomeya imitator]
MEHGVFKYTSEDEERILGGLGGEAIFLKTPSISELKRKYESDTKRMINLQLHMVTLGQYYKEGKIPRGLRSNIRPNLFQGNTIYCARFVMLSNKYAMDTILLNIEYLQEESKKLQQNTEGVEQKIKALITIEEWDIFKEKVEKESEKLRNELEEIKRKKWNRDLEDYEAGHIYPWQRESNKPMWKKKGGHGKNRYNDKNKDQQTQEERRQAAPPGTEKKRKKKQTSATETSGQQETGSDLVVNISDKVLTLAQISILSKGLSFSPCSHTDWFNLQMDLERFFRSIKLKEWFQDKNILNIEENSEFNSKSMGLRKHSEFTPMVNSAVINAFEKAVRGEIEELRNGAISKFKHPNITVEESRALKELVHDGDIIIKPADKGGAVVIMDRQKYIAEIESQLRDDKVYHKLECDPKFNIMTEIKKCLEEAVKNNVIDQELMNYLYIEFSRTPVIYTTPKIHKTLMDPPGRPIVSGVDSVFSRMGTFLDKILNPIAKKSKSYIQDTTDFLKKLEDVKLEGEVILASYDVVSLYTSIEHQTGLKAIGKKLDTIEVSMEGKEFVLKLLEIILGRSYFLFGDTFYSQTTRYSNGGQYGPRLCKSCNERPGGGSRLCVPPLPACAGVVAIHR